MPFTAKARPVCVTCEKSASVPCSTNSDEYGPVTFEDVMQYVCEAFQPCRSEEQK